MMNGSIVDAISTVPAIERQEQKKSKPKKRKKIVKKLLRGGIGNELISKPISMFKQFDDNKTA